MAGSSGNKANSAFNLLELKVKAELGKINTKCTDCVNIVTRL